MTDPELLQRFLTDRDPEAFRVVVDRHLPMVYATAERLVNGDKALAKDICQEVFSDLALKARHVSSLPTAGGWLHNATRFEAFHAIREARRRRLREIAAHPELMQPEEIRAEWERLRPVIDEILGSLTNRDRDAIMLRFFQDLDYAEVGQRLGKSSDAARSIVNRALERMRSRLRRLGIDSTSAALGLALANRIEASPPEGLGSWVVRQSTLSKAGISTAAGGSVATLWNGAVWLAGSVAVGISGFVAVMQWEHASLAEADARAAALDSSALNREAGEIGQVLSQHSGHANAGLQSPATPKASSSLKASLMALGRDPSVRAAWAKYMMNDARAQYAALLRKLGWSEAQIDHYLALYVQMNPGPFGQNPPEFEAARKQAEQDALSLLDAAASSNPKTYAAAFKAREAETLVEGFIGQQAGNGVALSPDQSEQLNATVMQNLPTQHSKGVNGPTPIASVNWDNVFAQASTFLTTDQVELLKEDVAIALPTSGMTPGDGGGSFLRPQPAWWVLEGPQ